MTRADKSDDILKLATKAIPMAGKIKSVWVKTELPLKKLMTKALTNPEWPAALPDKLICRTREDRIRRAQEVAFGFVAADIKSKRVLDFGCGTGLTSQALEALAPDSVVAFDPLATCEADTDFYSNWDQAKAHAPFDFILVYDVLDHLVGSTQEQILAEIHSVLAPDGIVQIRCHPWCSRHGTHLPAQLNRAFAHVVNPLASYTQEPTIKLTMPLAAYDNWFRGAGFIIANQRVIRHEVEPFIINTFREELTAHWGAGMLRQGVFYPAPQLEIEYVDYLLRQEPV